MRLVRSRRGFGNRVGLINSYDRMDDAYHNIETPPSLSETLATLSSRRADFESLIEEATGAVRRGELDGTVSTDDISFLPPVEPSNKVICVGENYSAHLQEAGGDGKASKNPELFAKFSSALIGNRAPIVRPAVSVELDWEVELAVVIGRTCRRVSAEAAAEYVAGYTVLNDVSVRDYQNAGSQWLAGKTFDDTTPVGPWIVTADEIRDPENLALSLTVDGETMQKSNTKNLMRSTSRLIAFISSFITLEPGDVISTGTPEGVGLFRNPQVWLLPGQKVVATVEGIGSLENVVVDEVVNG